MTTRCRRRTCARPFLACADNVVHALTKYLAATATPSAGHRGLRQIPLVASQAEVQALNEPESLSTASSTRSAREAAYIARARVVRLRNKSGANSPFNSFLILQGYETLAVRMDPSATTRCATPSTCKVTRR